MPSRVAADHRTPRKSRRGRYVSTACAIINGPHKPATEVTMMAADARAILRFSPLMTGSRRLIPVNSVTDGAAVDELLRLYEFVVICAALRVINLNVLWRGFQ